MKNTRETIIVLETLEVINNNILLIKNSKIKEKLKVKPAILLGKYVTKRRNSRSKKFLNIIILIINFCAQIKHQNCTQKVKLKINLIIKI